MNAVIYARYSPGPNQTENSIHAQLHACREYAKARGYSIVHEYVDEAVSGRASETKSRQNYQRMLREAKTGKFGAILAHKYDRLARTLSEHVSLDARMHGIGVDLIAVAQDFGRSKEGKIMRNLMWSLSEYYSENLAEEVRKGHRENALLGLHNGGRPLFGYDVDEEGHYVVNELEAGFVRKAFQYALDGKGNKPVADEMNAAGLTGRLGSPFTSSSIYELLHNAKYAGIYLYNPDKKCVTREERLTRPNAIRVEGVVPAIVSEETFEEVQRIMNSRRRMGRKAKNEYLCSGLLHCACGSKMHAHLSKRKGHEYFYYRCAAHCGAPVVKMDEIDAVVKTYLRDLLSERTQKLVHAAIRKYQSATSNSKEEFESAREKELVQREKEYKGLMQNMKNPHLPDEVVADMGREMQRLKGEMEAMRNAEPPKDYTTDQILDWLEHLKNGPDAKAVQLLVERIDVRQIQGKKEATEFNVTSTLNSVVGKLELVDGLEPPTC